MANLPPGPRSKILTTNRVLAKPFEWFPKWRERYGDPYRLPVMNGTVTMTGDRGLIKEIFATSPDNYDPWAPQTVTPFAGPGSLLVVNGDRHKRDRKLMNPPFHGDRMRSLSAGMAEAARRHVARAAEAGETTILELGQETSLEIIIRAVFGVSGDDRIGRFTGVIKGFMESAHPALLFFKPLHNRLFPPWNRYRRAYAAFDELLQEQIDRARAEPGEDILSMMLAARYEDGTPMADDDVRDECRTLLIAGHETTAVTLSWCIDALHRRPELAAQVRERVDGLDGTPEAYAADDLLENVAKETLRFHPVVTEILRMLNTPMKLGEFEIPAGEGVSASILHVHMDPEIYEDPTSFNPDRFSDRRYGPTEYLPFGGGHRRCLGAAFAMHELKIVLGVWMRECAFELKNGEAPRPVRRNVTLSPHDEVPVRVSKR